MTEKINKMLHRLYGEKVSQLDKSHLPTRLASYPAWRMSQLTFHTSHYKTRRTRLEERPAEPGQLCCDGGRVTLLAGRNVSPYKNFGSPSRVNSGLTRQSEHVGALLVWKKDHLPMQFPYKRSLKLTQLGE